MGLGVVPGPQVGFGPHSKGQGHHGTLAVLGVVRQPASGFHGLGEVRDGLVMQPSLRVGDGAAVVQVRIARSLLDGLRGLEDLPAQAGMGGAVAVGVFQDLSNGDRNADHACGQVQAQEYPLRLADASPRVIADEFALRPWVNPQDREVPREPPGQHEDHTENQEVHPPEEALPVFPGEAAAVDDLRGGDGRTQEGAKEQQEPTHHRSPPQAHSWSRSGTCHTWGSSRGCR
jgi:hypothetical protein